MFSISSKVVGNNEKRVRVAGLVCAARKAEPEMRSHQALDTKAKPIDGLRGGLESMSNMAL
jgi:hypothetical protein